MNARRPRRSEPFGGRATEPPRVSVDGAELRPILERLLEVVADDLVELERALADLLEPRCVAFV